MTTTFRGPLAIGLLTLATIGCGGGEQAQTPPATTAPATTAPAATTPAVATSTGETDFGVPECDSYMKKYRACVNANVPENMRATFNQTLDQTAASWRQAAATPQGKAGLASACQQAETMAKQSLQAYNCTW